MIATIRPSLEETLAQPYRFEVIPDEEDGGYVISFPDLPGCMTQVETLAEVAGAAEEIRLLWLETEFERAQAEERPQSNA